VAGDPVGSRLIASFARPGGNVTGMSSSGGEVTAKQLEARHGDRAPQRLPAPAAELVALKVDVIFVYGTRVTLAAMRATKTIPIVFAGVGDPVGLSVASQAGVRLRRRFT
jgi:ABC-type uncharacterized transport system substrate-binding protein